MLNGSRINNLGFKGKVKFLSRIFPAYFIKINSHLTFWHEEPALNENCPYDRLGEYYMTFFDKAAYEGPFDDNGIPLLDYRGDIGRQYNPIAIAQYGLGNYNLFLRTKQPSYMSKAKRQADWLVDNLEKNRFGVYVWNHYFNVEYKMTLTAPWYSGLAQGSGISLLGRIFDLTKEKKYLDCAARAYSSLMIETNLGGVISRDEDGGMWIEEYIIPSPCRVLNGFIWALWGVWDYYLLSKDSDVKANFDGLENTLRRDLPLYDTGYWSLYELADLKLKMIASPFYHSLHIVQLKANANLTGCELYSDYAKEWKKYAGKRWNKSKALIEKALFKVIYY